MKRSPLPPASLSTAAAAMVLALASSSLLRPASCLAPAAIAALRGQRGWTPSRVTLARHRHRTHHSRDGHAPGSLRSFPTNNNGGNDLWYPPSLMDHMLQRIDAVNQIPYQIQQSLVDFTVNGRILGKVTPKVADRLAAMGPTFELSTGTNKPTLTLGNEAGSTVEQRTDAVASVMERLRDEGYVTGWRDELYPVSERFDAPPLFLVERAAASLLGTLEYGVHINGLVEVDGETKMWMARRSRTKSKFPGFLDHIVAGGQPAGLSLMDNVVKECAEEAGIPEELTRRGVKPAGAISYVNYGGPLKHQGEGVMSRVVLFCYDLTLPPDFVPTAEDGEVESFFTWGLEDIARSMDPEYEDPIKPNCYPVIIDYLLRSGAISPDSPKYLDVLRSLRSGTCQ